MARALCSRNVEQNAYQQLLVIACIAILGSDIWTSPSPLVMVVAEMTHFGFSCAYVVGLLGQHDQMTKRLRRKNARIATKTLHQ